MIPAWMIVFAPTIGFLGWFIIVVLLDIAYEAVVEKVEASLRHLDK